MRRAAALWLSLGALMLVLVLTGCTPRAADGARRAGAAQGVSALETTDLDLGNGAMAGPGSRVTVHYTGWLFDRSAPEQKGAKFDSSYDHHQPFQFKLGAGQVIPGWDQGVQGMKVGGRRRLVVPASLAYGDDGAGGVIPPRASLVFEVTLLATEAPGGG